MAERKCCYCGRAFVADRRVDDRQKVGSVACQKLRKQENNRLYREKNPRYWKTHYEDHVNPWRQPPPDYQRQWRQRRKVHPGGSPGEIEAEKLRKAIEFAGRTQFYLREIQAAFIVKPSFKASLMFQSP